ncbi:anaerobic selenocysteine-containing dehydrogenase [Kibdelosporangium banguiense]|uniref:Anaerobic selenocysteine-containing dehydrogenase n=1 Tax=Kibdelosporangium banguiense TaxID=1365924 RepID=A0ABS4TQM7_9PSEU|nr:molybdopterin-dependent oxidoreductase [Kibdelosporangium banguiense]MBP2326719.1 anaerobic selenocysteine-containing dehydrogenase [Kibdelosporangium banguiense]
MSTKDGETAGVSRRSLLAGGVVLPALVPYSAQASTGGFGAPAAEDFTDGSAALAPDKIVHGACQFCNSACRLTIGMKAGRVISILGEPDDPVQDGNPCVKGPMMAQLAYNPLRLTTPLRRVAGAKGDPNSRFEPVSWDKALELIADKFLALRDQGEARAIANRTTGRLPRGTGSLVHRLFTLLGSPNDTDVGPVCNDAGGNALAATFGLGNFTNGYGVDEATGKQDLASARYILMLGTNQAETHPVTFAHLLRGHAKLIVVDPRRTPTAVLADEWVAPKPHTDFALVLGILHEVITTGRYDRRFVDQWVLGFNELRDHIIARGYTADWAASVTDVPARTIRRIAADYATTRPAAIFCNAGISHQLGAFDTYRAIAMLAAITGNIGVPGGGCNFMHNTWPGGLDLPPLTVPTPPQDMALPVGPDAFADAILTGKPYRLRAVITEGNPLISSANTNKVKKAYAALEFYVYTGLFMEEAAYYADVILPVVSGLEFEGVYMRRDDRAIRWQDAALPPVGQSRTDPQIWIDLAHAIARRDTKRPARHWTDAFPPAWRDHHNLWNTFVANTPGMGGMTVARLRARTEPLQWPCPTVSHPGVSTLYLDHPTWYQAAEALNPANRGKRFLTPSGKVEIYTPQLEATLAPSGHQALPVFFTHPEVTGAHPTIAYQDGFVANPVNPHALTHPVHIGVPGNDDIHRRYPLMGMTGRPSVAHFATVTHWTFTGEQLNGIRLVQIHPDTAARHRISNNDTVVIETPRGSVTATALLEPHIRPDTIYVPNTFGPAQQVGDIFGNPRYDAVNTLIDDHLYDNLSGQQAYKCFACRVKPAHE